MSMEKFEKIKNQYKDGDITEFSRVILEKFSLKELISIKSQISNDDQYSEEIKGAVTLSVMAKTAIELKSKSEDRDDSDTLEIKEIASAVQKSIQASDPISHLMIGVINFMTMIGLLLLMC